MFVGNTYNIKIHKFQSKSKKTVWDLMITEDNCLQICSMSGTQLHPYLLYQGKTTTCTAMSVPFRKDGMFIAPTTESFPSNLK